MPNVINGTSTGSGGLITSGDDSGVLNIQTNEVTAVSVDASQNVTFTNAANLPNTFGFKNRIINGAMVIDQRNAGASVSVTTSPYTLDRWKAQTLTGGSVQQITSTVTNFINSLKYTSSASNSFVQIGQQIEYQNCYDLQNQTVSMSFWAKANNSNAGSTALVVRTRTVAGVNGTAIFTGANVDTSVTLTTSAALYTVTRTLPATFGALSFEFLLGANVSGDGFEVTGVQLEKGSTATSFDYRPYSTELSLCQRYYQQWDYSAALGSAGATAFVATKFAGNDAIVATTSLNMPMRTSPTISSTNASARGVFSSGVSAVTITAIVAGTATTGLNVGGAITITCANNSIAAGFGWVDQVGFVKAVAEL